MEFFLSFFAYFWQEEMILVKINCSDVWDWGNFWTVNRPRMISIFQSCLQPKMKLSVDLEGRYIGNALKVDWRLKYLLDFSDNIIIEHLPIKNIQTFQVPKGMECQQPIQARFALTEFNFNWHYTRKKKKIIKTFTSSLIILFCFLV